MENVEQLVADNTAWINFQNAPWLETLIWLGIIIVAAIIANFIVKKILVQIVRRLLSFTQMGRDESLGVGDVIARLANIMPALVIAYGIDLVPHLPPYAPVIIKNVANAFIILTIALAIANVFDVMERAYERKPKSKLRPIKGLIQLIKIAVYAIAAILMLAALIDKSPLILLSGLGAMAAVLMLVFQDTLLGLVAGVQISSTDMVRVGDWIQMDAMGANGEVTEIALHTVKVQNFDNTITTIPIRKLVTDSYINWRGMSESGGRRISRSVFIDQSSISFLSDEQIKQFHDMKILSRYMDMKEQEITTWNKSLGDDAKIDANTRRLTNIGSFRAYMLAYLQSHPGIHKDMTLMVLQQPPSPQGIGLQVYAFTNTVSWGPYENIQADIFDHFLSILPYFGLRVFQNPTGYDMQHVGMPEKKLTKLTIDKPAKTTKAASK